MNLCVCCGEVIPEGRQICWNCEHQESTYRCAVCYKIIPKPKFSFGGRGDGKSMIGLMYNMKQLCCSDECWNEFAEEIRREFDGE